MFYHLVVSSIIFYTVVCWGSWVKVANADKLNKLRKVGSVLGVKLESLVDVLKRRMQRKLCFSNPANHTGVISEPLQL